MAGCVEHRTFPLDYQKRWDFQQPEHVDHIFADPLTLLLCLSNGSMVMEM